MTTLNFEEKLRLAVKNKAPLPNAGFVNRLGNQLMAINVPSLTMRERLKVRLRQPVWTLSMVLFLIILLSTLIIGPQNVIAAVKSLLGYIPGIGFVEDTTGVRVLAEPVSLTHDGITVTVENMISDENQTVILYTISNIPVDEFGEFVRARPENSEAPLLAEPWTDPDAYVLQSPDGGSYAFLEGKGQVISLEEGLRGWGGRLVFEAIPPKVNEVTFVIPRMNVSEGFDTEKWALVLALRPAAETDLQPGGNIVPVMTPTIAMPVQTLEPSLQDEVRLEVQGFTYNADSLTLKVGIRWMNPTWELVGIDDYFSAYYGDPGQIPHYFSLHDANGVEIPLELNTAESPGRIQHEQRAEFVLEAHNVNIEELAWPLQVDLEAIHILAVFPNGDDPAFTFAPENPPQPGECQAQEAAFSIYGSQVNVMNVCYFTGVGGIAFSFSGGSGGDQDIIYYGLEVQMLADDNILGLRLDDTLEDTPCIADPCPSGGSGSGKIKGVFYNSFSYTNVPPEYPAAFMLGKIDFILPGFWSVRFELP